METYIHPGTEPVSSAELGGPRWYDSMGCAAPVASPRVTRSFQINILFQKVFVGTMLLPNSMSFGLMRRDCG